MVNFLKRSAAVTHEPAVCCVMVCMLQLIKLTVFLKKKKINYPSQSTTACPNTHLQYSTMPACSTLYSKLDKEKTVSCLFLSNATPLIVHARDAAVPFWRGRLLRVNWHQQLNLLLDFWKNQKIFTTKIARPCL